MNLSLGMLSIKARIIAVAVVTTTLALLAASSIFVVNQMNAARESLVSSVAALAQVSAINASAALAFRDRQAAAEIVAALAQQTGILVAEIYLADGTLFASQRSSHPQHQALVKEENIAREKERAVLRKGAPSYYSFEHGYLVLVHRIEVDGMLVGHVDLMADGQTLRTEIRRQLGFAALVFAGSLLVAYLLASWLQRFISAPLVHLASTMREVSQSGDYALRARKTTADETGVLIDGFNAMVGQIQGRDAALAKAVAELHVAKQQADAANAAKSAFLAAMSHEIRTPMNGVVGMIDVLEQSSLKSSQAETVKTVRESAYALLAIVDDVLDFSKIEAGQFQVDSELMGVAAVVERVCDTLDHLASKKGVELTLFIDPAIPALLLGDAARLRQVLLNLIGNAIKFSSAQQRSGQVSVRANLIESALQQVVLAFSVADNGIGMDQETLARLFTPFTQADASTTRRFGGTGLGLSISHGLIELMGGKIEVHSEPGQGSTFTMRLPLALPPDRSAVDAETLELAGLRCLVIGGHLANDLAVYLMHGGAAVQQVRDLAAAREWFRTCPSGLWIGVMADIDLAGGETLAELRAIGSSRPHLKLRFVVIERGRRHGRRVKAADLVCLDRGVLRRTAFVTAVAVIAGRLTTDAVEEPPFEGDTIPAPLSVEQAGAQGRLILIAEDNEINQKVVLKQLALLGFTSDIASTGRQALEYWRRGNYALLLTDLHMPEMDGYELAAAIRQAEAGQRHIPIIALTANALKGEAKYCRDLGMDDYMTKPVQLADLKAMLRKWLPATAKATPDIATPRMSKPGARPLVLDVNVLKALVGDEPAVIGALLRNFQLSAAESAMQIRAACQAGEAIAVQEIAHRLKSSARTVGALALGELCAKMEVAAQAGGLEALAELHPMFEAEMAAVEALLDDARVGG